MCLLVANAVYVTCIPYSTHNKEWMEYFIINYTSNYGTWCTLPNVLSC